MTTTPSTAAERRAELVNALVERGVLTDPAWREAFSAVPREAFVPRFARRDHNGNLVHHNYWDDDGQSTGYLAAVYSDASLITQFDATGTATSSSTQPSLMAIMLERLDVHDGHKVLEIGAGTGYNAALLAHRLGNDAVTTIDIDPDVVEDAENALANAGYRPAVVCGDGAEGVPGLAPFDRIIATCGVSRIPPAWIAQTKPGGKILANTGFGLIVLTVTAGTATGHFDTEPAAFMQLRHTPDEAAMALADVLSLIRGDGKTRPTSISQELDHPVIEFLAALILPEIQRTTMHIDPPTHVLIDPASGSWAKAHVSGDIATVTEHGPRYLWEELSTVITDWNKLGQPSMSDYALTIDPDGTHQLSHPKTGWTLTLS